VTEHLAHYATGRWSGSLPLAFAVRESLQVANAHRGLLAHPSSELVILRA
jgi:hypothetical protein